MGLGYNNKNSADADNQRDYKNSDKNSKSGIETSKVVSLYRLCMVSY